MNSVFIHKRQESESEADYSQDGISGLSYLSVRRLVRRLGKRKRQNDKVKHYCCGTMAIRIHCTMNGAQTNVAIIDPGVTETAITVH